MEDDAYQFFLIRGFSEDVFKAQRKHLHRPTKALSSGLEDNLTKYQTLPYRKSFRSCCSFWRVEKMRLFTVPKGMLSCAAISRYLKPATCMAKGSLNS